MNGIQPREMVLVVDDDEDILELVRFNLSKEGFTVRTALTGETALKVAAQDVPNLILLDLMLPGMSGLEVTRKLKGTPATQGISVVMLSAKGEESDIVVGLELGADDYIVKPFSPRILMARLRAVLRRRAGADTSEEVSAIHIRGISIFPERHEVVVEGNGVPLTATEFRLLLMLARRPGWVFTRAQIVDKVRGEDYPVTDRSVDVHIVSLRKKLGSHERLIETVRGVGYRFRDRG